MANNVEGLGYAIDFMLKAFDGMTDKGGRPYYEHNLRVMARLGPNSAYATRIIAVLHDVIEDTEFTAEDLLAYGFSPFVVECVELLSRPKPEDRNGETYIQWIERIAASNNLTAIAVKIADLEDNSDPQRIAKLPEAERDIIQRYERALRILRPKLALGSE